MRITQTNLPLKNAEIRFNLAPNGEGTRVTVSPLYELKFGIVGRLLDRFYVHRTYQNGMQHLLRGLKDFIESQGS